MADRIGGLFYDLGLDAGRFNRDLTQAQGRLGKFSSFAKASFIGLAAGATAALAGLASAVDRSIDHADKIGKVAQKIGVTTEALSRLEYGARQSDLSLDQLAGGLAKLARNMADVAGGATTGAASAFRELGIAVTDSMGQLRAPDLVLRDLAERFSNMPDGARKTALAFDVLGRSGSDLIPLLNGGIEKLDEFAAAADRTGNTISQKTAQAAERLNDAVTRLQQAFEGTINKVTSSDGMISSMDKLAETMESQQMQNAIVGTTDLVSGLADILARTVLLAGELLNVLPKALAVGEDAALYNMPGYQDMLDNARGIDPVVDRSRPPSSWDQLQGMRPNRFDPVSDPDRPGSSWSRLQDMFGTPSQPGKPPGDFTSTLSTDLGNVETSLVAVNDQMDRWGMLTDTIGNAMTGVVDGFVDAFSDLKITGQEAFDILIGGARDLGKELLSQALQQGLKMLLGAFSGNISLGAPIPMRGFIPGITGPKLFAEGGRVFGPGGPTSDSVPAMLSAGEFVVNAKAASRWGSILSAINSGVLRFSTGGMVPGGESGPEMHLPFAGKLA